MATLGFIKIPLLGGASVGLLAAVNILASGWRYVRGGLYGFGASIAHVALVLLIISGVLQYYMRVEGSMVLREGTESDTILVGAKNGSAGSIMKLPFKVKLVKFSMENGIRARRRKAFQAKWSSSAAIAEWSR